VVVGPEMCKVESDAGAPMEEDVIKGEREEEEEEEVVGGGGREEEEEIEMQRHPDPDEEQGEQDADLGYCGWLNQSELGLHTDSVVPGSDPGPTCAELMIIVCRAGRPIYAFLYVPQTALVGETHFQRETVL
jgi:hypothetical protein